jgi:hypothetical protein
MASWRFGSNDFALNGFSLSRQSVRAFPKVGNKSSERPARMNHLFAFVGGHGSFKIIEYGQKVLD